MKLLFDQNLPDKLVSSIEDIFPNSRHVKRLGLSAVADNAVWDYAKKNGFSIISKDADFRQMSFLYGSPPKFIWIRIGNSTTDELGAFIRANNSTIKEFLANEEMAMLVLS